MFDFLNKPLHNHPPKQQSAESQIKNQFSQKKPILPRQTSLRKQDSMKKSNSVIFAQSPKKTLQDALYGGDSRSIQSINTSEKKHIFKSPTMRLQKRQLIHPQSLQLLKNILVESQNELTKPLKELSYIRRQRSEQNVYNYATSVNSLQFIYGVMQINENYNNKKEEPKLSKKDSLNSEKRQEKDVVNPYIGIGITNIINGGVWKILNDIEKVKNYQIYRKYQITKEDLPHLKKLDDIRLLKIKNNQQNLEDNLIKLRGQFQTQMLTHQANKSQKYKNQINHLQQLYDIDEGLLKNDKDYFSAKHPRTKQARQFVKNIQQSQYESDLNYQQRKAREQELKQEKKEKEKIQHQKAMSEKHTKLKIKILQKRQKKYRDIEEQQKIRQIFEAKMQKYKTDKPLFVKRHEDYINNFVKVEEQINKRKIQKIKKQRQPLNVQELDLFKEKYLEQRNQNLEKKKEEFQLMKIQLKKQLEQLQQDLHHGVYYEIVRKQLQQIKLKNLEDPQKQAKEIRSRQKAYAYSIKIMHKPKIDPLKRLESQNFIEQNDKNSIKRRRYDSINISRSGDNSQQNGYSYEQPDSKKDGLRNLRILHDHIKQQRINGTLKTSKADSRSQSVTLQPKINYLDDLKKQREGKPKFNTIDNEVNEIDTQNVGSLKIKAQALDARLKRNQIKIKNNAHTSHQQAQIEQDYLSAIKMKMKLLQNFD